MYILWNGRNPKEFSCRNCFQQTALWWIGGLFFRWTLDGGWRSGRMVRAETNGNQCSFGTESSLCQQEGLIAFTRRAMIQAGSHWQPTTLVSGLRLFSLNPNSVSAMITSAIEPALSWKHSQEKTGLDSWQEPIDFGSLWDMRVTTGCLRVRVFYGKNRGFHRQTVLIDRKYADANNTMRTKVRIGINRKLAISYQWQSRGDSSSIQSRRVVYWTVKVVLWQIGCISFASCVPCWGILQISRQKRRKVANVERESMR